MTTKRWLIKKAFCGVLLAIAWLCARPAYAAPVSEKEALEIAEFWYPAEVNHYEQKGWKRRGIENKAELLSSAKVARLRYLVGKDAIVNELKGNQDVLAYIVEFSPRGYVVLSADDRLTPLLAFDIDSDFSWEAPEEGTCHSYSRMYLNAYADSTLTYLKGNRGNATEDQEHNGWLRLRSLTEEQKALPAEEKSFTSWTTGDSGMIQLLAGGTPDPGQAEIFLQTALWGQSLFYNYEVQDHIWWAGSGSPPSDWKDHVQTGCTATALAITLRYHEWPIRGIGSHTWEDSDGDVHGGQEDFPFEDQVYQWANMWTDNINAPGPHYGENDDIAALMYHAGLLVAADWGVSSTGGAFDPEEINDHMRYKDTAKFDALSETPTPEANCTYGHQAGYEYFFCPTLTSWTQASLKCLNAGMHLARIVCDDENTWVASHNPSSDAWIGAYDIAYEGEWKWQDNPVTFWHGDQNGYCEGEPGTSHCYYNNWGNNEPGGGSSENCGLLMSDSKQWLDYECNSLHPYICKRPVNSNLVATPIIESITGGLPVLADVAGWEWSGGCWHANVIDGYRENVPAEETPDSYYHLNNGHGHNSGWWAFGAFCGCPSPYPANLTAVYAYMTPENYIYVSNLYGGQENGGLQNPYNTVAEGEANVPAADSDNPKGGKLWIRAGYYTGTGNFPFTFDEPMEIASYMGDVNIGNRLYLKSSGSIQISAGGRMELKQ